MDIGTAAKTLGGSLNLDLIGAGMDAIGKALSLPSVLVDAAKIGLGVATGNVLLVADGGKGLLSGFLGGGATTEYKPTEGLASTGYAAPAGQVVGAVASAIGGPAAGAIVAPLAEAAVGALGGAVAQPSATSAQSEPTEKPAGKTRPAKPSGSARERPVAAKYIKEKGKPRRLEGAADPRSEKAGSNQPEPAEPVKKTDPAAQPSAPATPAPAETKTEMRKQLDACRTVLDHFESLDRRAALFGINDGLVSKRDLEAILGDTTASDEVKEAARYLLTHQQFFFQLDGAAGIGRPDGLIGRDDLYAMISKLEPLTRTKPRDPAPPPGQTDPAPPPAPTPDPAPTPEPPGGSPDPVNPPGGTAPPVTSPLDPNIAGYRDALRTLSSNWNTFDSAIGGLDGKLGRENLQAILGNPAASPQLKQAAQFLIDHPEYFNRLEMAAHQDARDGVVVKADVAAELNRVNADLGQWGSPGVNTGDYGLTPGGGTPIGGILNDPNLSIEEKLELILMSIMEKADSEILGLASDLEAAASTRDSAKSDTSEAGQKKFSDASRKYELLQLRMQKLMERRTQMFTLMSNVSEKFNEMAKLAIQNLGRA